jgi:two-component system alkaline phosphatase synthesis response regulator PhoP
MEQPRIFLVEDEDAIVRPLASALDRGGFTVERIERAEEALEALTERRPRAIIMDIGLPGMSGLEACAEIRRRWVVPVLVLTARGEEQDRVLGLELGADDYLAKPFSARELVARLRALLRRAEWRGETNAALRVGELTVDLDRREVRVGSRLVALTAREFDLLALLAARSPAVVSRRDLISEVWDAHWDRPTQTLDVHVAQLRHKIERDPRSPRYLHTVRGVGYQVKDACDAA